MKKSSMNRLKWHFLFFSLWLLVSCVSCRVEESVSSDFEAQRERMVQEQIEKRGVKDVKVLQALRRVARHKFVPEQYRSQAYMDCPLPIGAGQTISQPFIVAFMTEILGLNSSKKVLEVGTGSGYQAAILAEICDKVYTIEIIESLGEKARDLLSRLGYSNIHVRIGDGYKGWKESSPFDAIIVTCAPTHIPDPLKDQLTEGGKMIIPVGGAGSQELILLVKEKGQLIERSIFPVRFVPMLKEDRGKY
jgi:protein-L-isoaspartate(D-aspartate) O-methyltransferase